MLCNGVSKIEVPGFLISSKSFDCWMEPSTMLFTDALVPTFLPALAGGRLEI